MRSVEYVLEHGTLEQMREAKQGFADLLKYQWEYYSELAFQRQSIQDEIIKALNRSAISDFRFSRWQRAVTYKYGLHPLCSLGSLSDPGGRFNVGDLNSLIPSFPALYLCEDKDTALQETLGQDFDGTKDLSAREIALSNPESETIVSVSGILEKVFDLRDESRLEDFAALIKEFTVSDQLTARAKTVGETPPGTVRTAKQLHETLLHPDWRVAPMRYDIPANPQIFGHLVHLAGIEGILYPSKLTKKDCLAVFVNNFEQSSSYIQLDDEAPHEKVPKRLDSTNWKVSTVPFSELINATGVTH